MSERKWCVMDLVTDHQSGKLRESSVWSNAGKAAVLWAYVKLVAAGNFEAMTLVIGAVLIGHEVGSRMMNMKQQQAAQEKPNA